MREILIFGYDFFFIRRSTYRIYHTSIIDLGWCAQKTRN